MTQGHDLAALACATPKEGHGHARLFCSTGSGSSPSLGLWRAVVVTALASRFWLTVMAVGSCHQEFLRQSPNPHHLDSGKGNISPGWPAQQYFSGTYFWRITQEPAPLVLPITCKHLIPWFNFFSAWINSSVLWLKHDWYNIHCHFKLNLFQMKQ